MIFKIGKSSVKGYCMKSFIGTLLGILLTINILGLSACGQRPPVMDPSQREGKGTEEILQEEKEQEAGTDSSSAQNHSDEVLKTLEMPLEDGKVLTLSVLGKSREDVEMYGVREICVYDGEHLLQSILIQEAIQIDGVDGIDEGYSQCSTADGSAALKDVNFDGYLDLEVCGWVPNNSIPYYYWIWNHDIQQFEYGFCLQLSEIDTVNQQLIAWYKVENGLYHTDYYRVNGKNQLELVNREIEDVRPK